MNENKENTEEKAPYGSFISYMANRPLTEHELATIQPEVDFPRSVVEAIGNSGETPEKPKVAGNHPRCITESEMLHTLMSRVDTLESEIERLREFINEHVYGSK